MSSSFCQFFQSCTFTHVTRSKCILYFVLCFSSSNSEIDVSLDSWDPMRAHIHFSTGVPQGSNGSSFLKTIFTIEFISHLESHAIYADDITSYKLVNEHYKFTPLAHAPAMSQSFFSFHKGSGHT